MITLDLPLNLETTLYQIASRQGMTAENLAIKLLDETLISTEQHDKSYAKGDFNFDLERMQKAVEAPSVVVPRFNTPEELLTWMDNLTEKDFAEQ